MPYVPRIEAGKLRKKIDLVAPSTAQDSAGGPIVGDETVVLANWWASIEFLVGRELYAAQQKVSLVTHRITIRHPRSRLPGGVLADMLVRFEGRKFQVLYIDREGETRKMLRLL